MKSKFFTLVTVALFFSNMSFAKIFRLGFTGPHITGTDFTDAQAAHDAASTGDTLLFYPGSYNLSANKKLVYLGYGYFTSGSDANPNLQLISGTCQVSCDLHAGASGSVFEGIETLYARSYYGENVNDIVIRRCKGSAGVFNSAGTTCNNWQIIQCYDMALNGTWSGGNTTNLRVENSKISGVSLDGSTLHTGQFNNCYFEYINPSLNNNAINFQNCIFTNVPSSDFSNSLFQYCLFGGSDPGLSGSHNQFSVSFQTGATNNIFVGSPNVVAGQSTDGKYQLKAGSPAKGAGIGGTDLGIYGGTNPYKLSGMPSIPAFYKLTAPDNNATSNPYTITFSVRSNN